MYALLQEQNELGFALVSSNRNRIMYFHESYENTKRVQLHYLRNDLLYLAPITNFMFKKQIAPKQLTGDSCINLTINVAPILHTEMDISPYKLKNAVVVKATDPKREDILIHKNLQTASRIIEQFNTLANKGLEIARFRLRYIIKGYDMFNDFCKIQFDDDRVLQKIIQTDVKDELMFEEGFNKLRKAFTDAIMALDFASENFDQDLSDNLSMLKTRSDMNTYTKSTFEKFFAQ